MAADPSKRFTVEYLYRPGVRLRDEPLERLTREVCELGRRCLHPLPDYQVFLATREAFEDKVLTIARREEDGAMVGFCSAVLLPVDGVGVVLQLGHICVDPNFRGARVSNALCSKLVTHYFFRRKLVGRLWITNVENLYSCRALVHLYLC